MIKIFALALAIMALPSLTQAATFAFVDYNGYVRTVEANTATGAMLTAPNIATHSGVMLMNSVGDYRVVGQYVSLN